MLIEPISPELVLVDPELATVARPREYPVSVRVDQVLPLGVPLIARETRPARPGWLVALLGVSLLASGLLVSILLFRSPSAGDRPTVVQTVTAEADLGRSSRDLRFQTGTGR